MSRRARRQLPDLGRAAGAGRREDRRVRRAGERPKGRPRRFGIRLHVIVRETKEAWAAADPLISRVDDDTIAAAQQVFARMDSVGQRA